MTVAVKTERAEDYTRDVKEGGSQVACSLLPEASDTPASGGVTRACHTQTLSGELSAGEVLRPGSMRVGEQSLKNPEGG